MSLSIDKIQNTESVANISRCQNVTHPPMENDPPPMENDPPTGEYGRGTVEIKS